jgi:hypothetical protein
MLGSGQTLLERVNKIRCALRPDSSWRRRIHEIWVTRMINRSRRSALSLVSSNPIAAASSPTFAESAKNFFVK